MKSLSSVILILSGLLLFPISISSQSKMAKEGKLLHLTVDQDVINSADTLGYWTENNENITSYYFDVIRTDSNEYLLRYDIWEPEFIPGYRKMEIEETSTGERQICSYISFIDFIGPTYNIPHNAYTIDNGIWFFDDVYGHSFLSNKDTLYNDVNYYFPETRLYHICGNVDHREFVIARQDDDLHFVLADLSDSPEYNLSELPRLNFEIDDRPIALQKVTSRLFLIRIRDELQLYSFESDTFLYNKTILSNISFDKFKFRNDTLYFKNDEGLIRYLFSYSDSSLIEKKVIIHKVDYVDHDYRYALSVSNDSLRLINISQETEQKSWDLSVLNNPHRPILNYPDIYIHVETNPVGLLENSSKHLYLVGPIISTFPNPFNPIATIRYSLPSTTFAEINIYNVLGQKVATLVSNKQMPGEYQVQWNASSFPSGVYYSRLSTDTGYQQCRKMVLLK